MAEPSDDFVQYIQKLEKEKTGKELSHQEAEEAVNNLVGFFDLLLKIDRRNKLDNKESENKRRRINKNSNHITGRNVLVDPRTT